MPFSDISVNISVLRCFKYLTDFHDSDFGSGRTTSTEIIDVQGCGIDDVDGSGLVDVDNCGVDDLDSCGLEDVDDCGSLLTNNVT